MLLGLNTGMEGSMMQEETRVPGGVQVGGGQYHLTCTTTAHPEDLTLVVAVITTTLSNSITGYLSKGLLLGRFNVTFLISVCPKEIKQ